MSLQTDIQKAGITVPDNFFDIIAKYKTDLFKWNKIHNLTGAKDEKKVDAFIFDALYPVTFLPKVTSILDIGSGAGFPGMILAFALPQTTVTLVEPLAKRASFLQFIKANLQIENVHIVKKRVEEMEKKTFELITSKAVTDTKVLLDLSKNLYNADTKFLFYKGERVFDEVEKVTNMRHKIIKKEKRNYLLLGENI